MTSLDLWILLALAIACWLDKRRERLQDDEDAAAERARRNFGRVV